MWYIWHNWGHLILFFMFGVPVAALLALGWAGLRLRRGAPPPDVLTEAVLIVATVPWAAPLLASNPAHQGVRQLFLVPFVDLANQAAQGPRYLLVEAAGNLAVLAVFGFVVPIRYRVGLLAVAATAGAASASVETAQYVLDLHRVTSIDDVSLNTAGAVLGALASRRYWRARRSNPAAVAPRAGTGAAGPVPTGERPRSMR